MAQVPPEKLSELRSIIEATPQQNKYEYIKAKLMEYFADSQQRRLQRVLSEMPLGDMRPSELLNEMRRVAGTSLSENILVDLWAARLPPHAQAAVIAAKVDIADKTAIADAIVDSLGLRNINSVNEVNITSKTATSSQESNELNAIQQQLVQLTHMLKRILPRETSRKESRARSRSRSRSQANDNISVNRDVATTCWYHRTYGVKARACRKPCDFASGKDNNSKQQ